MYILKCNSTRNRLSKNDQLLVSLTTLSPFCPHKRASRAVGQLKDILPPPCRPELHKSLGLSGGEASDGFGFLKGHELNFQRFKGFEGLELVGLRVSIFQLKRSVFSLDSHSCAQVDFAEFGLAGNPEALNAVEWKNC